jgi:hypothetical protein
MTPLEIRIMLHYHVYLDDYEGPESNEILEQSLRFFVSNELLRKGDKDCQPQYLITAKGTAYVDQLRSVPVPVVRYVDPRFEV